MIYVPYRDEPSIRPAPPGLAPPQTDNPTDEERYTLTKYILKQANRLEDFDSIIKYLSPPPDITTIAPPGSFKGIKVGIIGGGAAGLSAAFELRKLGFDITIFEASEDRIGGRVYTYYFDEDKKYYGELGAMRIPVTHETSWHYINLFNLPTRPYIQNNENAFIYAQDVRVRNDPDGKNVMEKIYPKFNLTPQERVTPWEDLISYALETPLLNMSPEVREELIDVRPKYSPQILYWDYFNIRQVLEKAGLSRSAINLISSISPFTGSFYYFNYIEVLQESNPLSFTFLYEIVGGMVNLPLSFYNSLTNPNPRDYPNIPNEELGNIDFRMGTWVSGIHYNYNNGNIMLSYGSKNLKDDLTEEFDYVVSAIPFSTLRNVKISPQFSNLKMEAIREVGYSAAHKTLFLCNRRFWEEQGIFGGGSFTDMPISSIWYPSDHGSCTLKDINNPKCSPFVPGVFTASYNFDLDAIRVGNMYDGELAYHKIARQVEEVHGLPREYLENTVEDYVTFNWNQYSWSLGGFCYFRPEQKRLFSYVMTLPEYNYKVFFAGEHLSSTHGWLNGALLTGMKAANDIAKICKIRKGVSN